MFPQVSHELIVHSGESCVEDQLSELRLSIPDISTGDTAELHPVIDLTGGKSSLTLDVVVGVSVYPIQRALEILSFLVEVDCIDLAFLFFGCSHGVKLTRP